MAKKVLKKTTPKKAASSAEPASTEVALRTTVVKAPLDEVRAMLLRGAGMSGRKLPVGTITSNALAIEDDFQGMYGVVLSGSVNDAIVLEPPFNPNQLEKLTLHNNTLGPCISAMEINIDGTGFEIINKADPDNESPDEADTIVQQAIDFFNQPYIGESFTSIRKKLRVDREKVGYGCLEVIRDPKGQVIFVRHIDAKTVRLIKLGAAVPVTRKIMRGGKEVQAKIGMRFRRFVQRLGTTSVYFKEFQADMDLDVNTGKWAEPGTKIPFEQQATELLYFPLGKDVTTPYGVPRWIEQMPSILGSRQAEENNLDFFESGGVPPFIMIVQGGILAAETKDAIENQLAANGGAKQRGLVVEAFSSSGTLDDSNTVKVSVEKFGAGASNNRDSSFENYDAKCEARIRRSFRISPIFLGGVESFNYASAVASYMLAETQVFKPERDAFDEVVNLKLLPEILGPEKAAKIQFRSIPITVNDAEQKLKAIGMAAEKQAINKGEYVNKLNEVTGLNIQVAPNEAGNLPRLNQRGSEEASTRPGDTKPGEEPQPEKKEHLEPGNRFIGAALGVHEDDDEYPASEN